MKSTFLARRALLVLLAVFFFVPIALRGARFSLERVQNNIGDWLPARFEETKELDWFRRHFLGEQFVLVSWDGCTEDDTRLEFLAKKLVPDVASDQKSNGGLTVATDDRKDFIGERYGLYTTSRDQQSNWHEDWGGRGEKWLKGSGPLAAPDGNARDGAPHLESGDHWYFITPEGDLYRWDGGDSLPSAAARSLRRLFTGKNSANGSYLGTPGPEFYRNPRRLAARSFKTVTTGPRVLQELAREGGPLLGLSDDTQTARQLAKTRLTGTLFGADGRQTCLVVTLTEHGRRKLRRVLGRGLLGRPRGELLDLADEAGISPDQLKMGGPPVDNVAIDEEGEITLVRLVGLCVLLGLGLSWLCFRSLYITTMVFFIGGLSAVLSLAIVFWCGSSVDAVLMSMPAVVYVLGLSGAVHIINYYRDAVIEGGLDGAPEKAISNGWKPCTLAAITTALGLFSLYTSEILPIRKFGIYSGIGVLATLVLLFTYLPAALHLYPVDFRKRLKGAGGDARPGDGWLSVWIERFGGAIVRHNGKVCAVCLLVFAVFGYGLTEINTSVQLLKMFDADAKIIKDYRWLETHLGRLVPMEIVVRVPPAMMRSTSTEPGAGTDAAVKQSRNPLSFLERMEIVDRVAHVIDDRFGEHGQQMVGHSMSALNFVPVLPGAGGNQNQFTKRSVFSRRLEKHRNDLLGTDYLRLERPEEDDGDQEAGAELWRISLRLAALGDIDYAEFVEQLKSVVEPVMDAYQQRETILQQLAQQGGDRPSRVCILGYVSPQRPKRNSRPETQDDPVAGSSAALTDQAIDQAKIFAVTLTDLLARVTLTKHDPEMSPVGELEKDQWLSAISDSDAVVILRDHPDYDRAFIRRHAKQVIDVSGRHDRTSAGASLADEPTRSVSAVYTGVVPLVYKAQRTLMENLVESIGWAFVLIALVMMVVLRSPTAGLISMLPNIFPVVLIFGFMGWSGTMVDIGSMMTASVAMGVAVDDTVHFLTWFRLGLDKGLDRKGAIMLAYRRVATAMMQTTLIGGFGLAVFALSTFTPTQRFGYLMLALLAAALIGDLIFLPALLAGPLGRMFRPSTKGRAGTSEPLSVEEPPEGRIATPHAASELGADGKPMVLRHDKAHRSIRQ